jgi:hypothetical protein
MVLLLSIGPLNFLENPNQVQYKCLIQLSNYGGLGAYVIASLVHPQTGYQQTLSVSGDEIDWYEDLPEWYRFYENSGEDIDGITGASIQSGGRRVVMLSLDSAVLNAGYQLRFETAVENQKYYTQDLEVTLTDSIAGKNLQGTGYIRYVKLIGQ